ncbi:MAG: protein translocase subunit SecF [Aristaeellaceae bacterium]
MRMKNPMKPALLLSVAVILTALVMTICGYGMNLGLDFTGGLSMHFDVGQSVTRDEVANVLGGVEYAVTVQGANKSEVLVRTKVNDASMDVGELHTYTQNKLTAAYPSTVSLGGVSYVGPVAGVTLVKNAISSVLIATVLMLLYIAWRFDFHSGLASVLALVHDVAVMLAFMVILRGVIELNSSFIAAALTIVGYSINDTIVVFDRIRENAGKHPDMPRVEVVTLSVKESLGRTLMTTATTLVTIVALYILGVASIREFALPIIVGVIAGTWSSNLISGYIWAWLEEKFPKREKKPDEDDEE